MKVDLVLIDFQNDFCLPTGNLYVPGAENDVSRVAAMIDRLRNKIDDIHATLDSHHFFSIFHGCFWKGKDGKHPDPFTQISVEDVESGIWTTTIPGYFRRALEYVKTLKKNNRYSLVIWPPHCLIGSTGHTITEPLRNSLLEWEKTGATVDWVTKGTNIFTEHYSAVISDVVDASDPLSQLNVKFIETLETSDMVVVAGEASNFCVCNTIRDVASFFNNKEAVKKMVLLTNGMSPVPLPGYEKQVQDFFSEMTSLGAQLSTTTEFLS